MRVNSLIYEGRQAMKEERGIIQTLKLIIANNRLVLCE